MILMRLSDNQSLTIARQKVGHLDHVSGHLQYHIVETSQIRCRMKQTDMESPGQSFGRGIMRHTPLKMVRVLEEVGAADLENEAAIVDWL